jgi:hypothetical protein
MMQLRAGCESTHRDRLTIVCQINKLRLLERNPRAEKV